MVNTTKAVSARQRARAASMKYFELEKQREAIQVSFFTAMDAVDKVYAQRDQEIKQAESRAERAARASMRQADGAIVKLLDSGVSRTEVQHRLGVTAADVRRAEGERGAVEVTVAASDEGAPEHEVEATQTESAE